MSSKLLRIAIDGPAGAGKSTIARILARDLGIDYVDTGAMYRAIALKILRSGTDCSDEAALQRLLDSTDVDIQGGHVTLDGADAEPFIRTPQVSEMASVSSAIPAVRKKLVALQRDMGSRKSLVMDGRDIATNVLKDAEFKFYLTASVRVRALRRMEELKAKGLTEDLEKVEADISARDYRDSHRDTDPLMQAEDAVLIDSSDMSIEQVVAAMMGIIKA